MKRKLVMIICICCFLLVGCGDKNKKDDITEKYKNKGYADKSLNVSSSEIIVEEDKVINKVRVEVEENNNFYKCKRVEEYIMELNDDDLWDIGDENDVTTVEEEILMDEITGSYEIYHVEDDFGRNLSIDTQGVSKYSLSELTNKIHAKMNPWVLKDVEDGQVTISLISYNEIAINGDVFKLTCNDASCEVDISSGGLHEIDWSMTKDGYFYTNDTYEKTKIYILFKEATKEIFLLDEYIGSYKSCYVYKLIKK